MQPASAGLSPVQRVLRIGGTDFTDPGQIRDAAFDEAGATAAAIENLVSLGQDEEVVATYPDWQAALAAHDDTEDSEDLPAEPARAQVPALLHFIWVGRPPSQGAVRNILSWAARAANSAWRIILWTDSDINTGDWDAARERLAGDVEVRDILPVLDPMLADYYMRATRGEHRAFNMASDLARYSILARFGGVYADVDVGPGGVDLATVPVLGRDDVPMLAPQIRDRESLNEHLSPEELEELSLDDAVRLAATRAYTKNQLNNNLIITQPGSAFMRELILDVRSHVERHEGNESEWAENAALITGPQAVISTMFSYLGTQDRLMHSLDPDTLTNWSQLEWLTDESESQTYGQEASASTSSRGSRLLGRLKKFFSRRK